MKAVLINETDGDKLLLDNMMLIFCTAMRYSFNRLLEFINVGELQKDVASKYNLNIRQSKDAVESARQTILSQKEIVKMNYDDVNKKVKAIETILKDKDKNLSDKKINALKSKLAKRQRKLEYWNNFIITNTIPSVIFGKKETFLKRCKGLITNQEWKDSRNNRFYSRGDKSKGGNPNLRVVFKDNISYLEVSTLEKTTTNRAIKVLIPIYLPQKLSKKTGKVNGIHYRDMFLEYLKTGEAYQVELIKRNGRYYAHITFELPKTEVIYTGHSGMIGIDTNPNGFALTMIDNKGNYKWHTYLKQHELTYTKGNRRENLCGELVAQVMLIAKTYHCGIAIENLKFKNDKDVSKKFARIKNNFIYSKLLTMLESACYRQRVELVKVHPAYTSKIGLYKYCHQYGMAVHNGASMVIARRSYKFKEKVPNILKDNFVEEKYKAKFNLYHEWKKWSMIDKNIKIERKEVNKPDFWIVNRKEILGLII